jgi:hypothetical protein
MRVRGSQPAVAKRAGVINDPAKAIDERPAEKAAVGKLYPTLDASTLDLFAARVARLKALPSRPMAREIVFMKTTGTPLPHIDSIDPASMVFP